METMKFVTSEHYALTIKLVEERAKLIKRKAADKKKLAKTNTSLDTKIQSERYFNTLIAEINSQLDAIPSETVNDEAENFLRGMADELKERAKYDV